ncbi:NAD(P)H-hydrate dehydratase [Allofranklinella schreckenbergeri]|uniref:Bifunctional NAD(P)H-hydrate repair enzyme n=1 Tax=Allofranklinella schreckenbergeri TaxID=1076744 RepID=A0A3M6QWK4_9BURK|nr:NAD(P)H-hydrate dehydratase [Allofranklinella schreckenbergeri]RMX07406.1 NAD(P)H-hydrate dehydratase [Allofranklinella schreckenbergeri]
MLDSHCICTLGQSVQALLTPAQMAQADAAAIASGVPGVALMARAGEAVALAVARRWQPCRVAVLCGPGNNGGDGFVAAQWLRQRGWPVRLFLLGELAKLRGDAAWAASQWQGATEEVTAFDPAACDIAIDALFGAGLCRPLDGQAAALVQALNASGLPVCAVDVPSGLDGATGAPPADETAPVVQAALTVTFFRTKPGHWLLPGRKLCGELVLADIGIPESVLKSLEPPLATWLNTPALWRHALPQPGPQSHKYQRGHVLVWGGAMLTGAARLAAQAAQRAGAGLVTLAVPQAVWPVYAQSLQGCMVQALPEGDGEAAAHANTNTQGAALDAASAAWAEGWQQLLANGRRNVCLIGPGAGVNWRTRAAVLAALHRGKHVVLDADALSVFAPAEPGGAVADVFEALAASSAQAILTPHEGEFARLFGDLSAALAGDKRARAAAAARRAGAVVVLKGADTVVAAPDGRCAINANAPAWLATGGTGDVLAGLAAGWLAQGVPAFEAACAAVWQHGEAAQRLGAGMVADDLLLALKGSWG